MRTGSWKFGFVAGVGLLLTLANGVWALEGEAVRRQSPGSRFDKGRCAIQLVSGLLFSPTILAKQSSVMDYWQTNLRLSGMMTGPSPRKSPLRGNLEGILEITYSSIYKGSGSYMCGLTGLLRYNLIQPDVRWVPYVQAGIGVILNDAYQVEDQTDIGQAVEFTPQASAGVRFMLKQNCSLDAEVMFHHVSNAGIAVRNRGLNAFGGLVGVTWFWGGAAD